MNPEYIAEQEEEARRWYEEIKPFCFGCLGEMRGFIPSSVFEDSVAGLISRGLSEQLAKRCVLWVQ